MGREWRGGANAEDAGGAAVSIRYKLFVFGSVSGGLLGPLYLFNDQRVLNTGLRLFRVAECSSFYLRSPSKGASFTPN